MKLLPFAFSLIAAIALLGCATDYGSRDLTGGYSQVQLQPGTWRLGFSGNGYTSRETVQTFWLYRAAELTLEQGYDGFEIISSVSLLSFPAAPQSDARLYKTSVEMAPIYIQAFDKPYLYADIRLLKKPIMGYPPRVFDAAALKTALEPYVKGKLCASGNVCPHDHGYLRPPLTL